MATRLSALMKRDTIRAVTAGWVVSGPTGHSLVCRTYDDLVDAVCERTGVDRAGVSAAGLGSSAG